MLGREMQGLTTAGVAVVILILAVAVVSVVYVTSSQSSSDRLSSQDQQIAALRAQLQQLAASVANVRGSVANLSLPVMNQSPTIRTITETWYLSPSAHQDRFDPSIIVVNQGDTLHLTLIDNDTVAHDLVIGPPYSLILNATVPGLINDLTGEKFTTPATNNPPGVKVHGSRGNVSIEYSFVTKYSGIFEFVCTYHAEVGMIGYLAVLPNSAFITTTTTRASTGPAPASVTVSIVSGAGQNTSNSGYVPNITTVVLGVNNSVIWTNNDIFPHTVTSNNGSFYSGNMDLGTTFQYTFASPGVYTYRCSYHPWMTGTVIVKTGA